MSVETVAVTGGNGRIGESVLDELNGDYRTVTLARGKRREDLSDAYLTTDLTDAGEVYGSLAHSDADAVVHMGTIPTPLNHPEYVTYESNVMSAYHVLEAATSLSLEAVVLPSSINAMGSFFQDAPVEVEYLPVDEAHPVAPRDPYALGKYAMEVTADGFGRRPDAPGIVSLRYPWVAHEEELRDSGGTDRIAPETGPARSPYRDELYTYLHVDDAARAARAAVEASVDGHEVCWAVAADTTLDVPSEQVAAEAYPGAELGDSIDDHDALVTTRKAKRLLGWSPEHTWREL